MDTTFVDFDYDDDGFEPDPLKIMNRNLIVCRRQRMRKKRKVGNYFVRPEMIGAMNDHCAVRMLILSYIICTSFH